MNRATWEHAPLLAEVIVLVEALSLDDQAALVEVVSKRVPSARRAEIVREVAEARRDYSKGRVKCGSAANLMVELRSK